MTVNRLVSIFAGFVITLSVILGHMNGQIDITTMSWSWLTLFVGVNLFQMGFTGFCPLASILRAMGVKDVATPCGS